MPREKPKQYKQQTASKNEDAKRILDGYEKVDQKRGWPVLCIGRPLA
jgi:hypothetical protein